ncbi:MAG TPA: lysine--tRNA ligase [Syntrophales bacterium]|nr:lysine--tRNA ligase [Syntrophales bacterium]HPN07871.1 lysine--tRNA ligase [Syntrophales bacterium]HQB12824.1 lysine--tRNA ligase [Syntrophales bacterium]HQK78349.1 lysine--tRNA ligase [Syntrophales bacterium]
MEESELIKTRKEKIAALRAAGIDLYPNEVRVGHTSAELRTRFDALDNDALAEVKDTFSLAGRLMAIRNFGKASFISIQDRKGRLQGFIQKKTLPEEEYDLFRRLDVGDIIYIEGKIFKTKTGELTIEAGRLRLLAKAVHSLPEKWHGLTDMEMRYRRRHLDLIMNPDVREVFHRRSRIIKLIRDFMDGHDFLEVETPMMQPRAGGAAAKPFKTFHNTLGMDLYLRIAPELYLKRLVTGGLERVYEINRNFRNEGISTFHNPEFTMMEFYLAYATYEDLMRFTEELFLFLAENVFGAPRFTYQGTEINLSPPWRRISVREAVETHLGIAPEIMADRRRLLATAAEMGLEPEENAVVGKILMMIFEEKVEKELIQPTFVTQYPVEVSPLSRRNPRDPGFTDRFELYICGREIANAFSELNDPEDQRERFLMQLREREAGDEEAHEMDEDYVRTLEYAMPPTAGEGIGIDRLVMLFTDSASIRDVILFPQLRIRDEQ